MRVMIVTSEFHPRVGGIERYVGDLAEALSTDAEVMLVVGRGQNLPEERPFRCLAALNLAYPRSREDFLKVRSDLLSLVRDHRPDVVHLASAGLAVYAPALRQIASVFATVHCKDFTRPWQLVPGQYVPRLIRVGLSCCKRIFCVSEYAAAIVQKALPDVRVQVLTPGLSSSLIKFIERQRPAPRTPSDRFHVVTVGKLVRRKGHHQLLKILERFPIPVRWTIVGDGPMDAELRARASSSPLADHITFLGALSDTDLWSLVGNADLFALTPVEVHDDHGLDAEGFGLVFIEAAALGVPLLGSIYGGCVDAIPTDCGVAVDPWDEVSALKKISNFMRDQDADSAAAAMRRRIASECYNWRDRAEVLLGMYRL